MGIAGVSYQNLSYFNTHYQQVQKKNDSFTCTMNTVTAEMKKKDNGEFIGLTMIKDPNTNIFWGMKAKYAEDSTSQNPIIQVESNYGGKTAIYKIPINDINPNNASRLEMFALCSYQDQQGKGDNSKFGTYQTLKSFEEMSLHNGYFGEGIKEANTLEQFQNIKLNWENACKKTVDLLYKCNDLIQFDKGKAILNLFNKYPVKQNTNISIIS
ncbi:MAG: hypothetical protein N2645_22695 [Clostridia bacterium]|nr:hypothetical protein [Clostridia bacterium]